MGYEGDMRDRYGQGLLLVEGDCQGGSCGREVCQLNGRCPMNLAGLWGQKPEMNPEHPHLGLVELEF